jgi:hypothetical protein
MAQRLRFQDCRASRLPRVVGLCAEDKPRLAEYVNGAQQRLLYCKEAGNDGWYGTFAEIAFSVSQSNPYITTPRSVARIMYSTWCDYEVPVQNQFYEYLTFGNGRMPKQYVEAWPGIQQVYSRNMAVTFTDLSNAPQLIRCRITEASDITRRTVISGLDNNDVAIYTQDGLDRVNGVFLAFDQPYATTTYQFNRITGIQKDVTDGEVQYYQVDPVTGDEVLLLTMEPSETTAAYRRYYFDNVPKNCCPSGTTGTGQISVKAICKLDLTPVYYDTDYCLIQNLEAIIEECASIRYSEMDTPTAKQISQDRHLQAVRMLNGEINHYMGSEQPAIGFKPFGSASLRKQHIGTLI